VTGTGIFVNINFGYMKKLIVIWEFCIVTGFKFPGCILITDITERLNYFTALLTYCQVLGLCVIYNKDSGFDDWIY
jgi:hypothetical protein